jgi:hypothetical protein
MKFKADKGTATYEKLNAVMSKIQECRFQAKKLAEELGAGKYIESYQGAAGGIEGIEFDEQPKGWKRVYNRRYSDLYYPKALKSNKELIERLEALPIVSRKEVNETVGYEPKYFGTIGIWHRHDLILFEVPIERINGEDQPYTFKAPSDVVELTYSEFENIKIQILDHAEE